jgi:hypothetical protein
MPSKDITAAESEAFETERSQFRALLFSNPNYFGNLKDSAYQPVLQLSNNTFYEALGGVGFQPQFNRLEAVVYVYQPYGYGGDLCSPGTPEYVRFYSSVNGGATWTDLGLTSFQAHDIPEGTEGRRRLEYAVSLDIDPRKRFCFVNNFAQVRAILSWNTPPPPNDPNFQPVWGDVHDTNIQIDPLRRFPLHDLFKLAKLELPPEIGEVVDLDQPVGPPVPATLSIAELKERYRETEVEPHRYALTHVLDAMQHPARFASAQAAGAASLAETLGIDLPDLDVLFPEQGSTKYEELESIGLDTNVEHLVGVIRVKLPTGFLGGRCFGGSKEYVAFWADYDNDGVYDAYLGTTSVNVYDFTPLPNGGLEYAVFLPVNLEELRRPCRAGGKVISIRAIMSWNVPPPPTDPDHVPMWGNRLETMVLVKPGQVVSGHTPIIQTVGSMAVAKIDPGTGLADGTADLAGFTANDSPFGGEVILTGHIANAPDISSGATSLRYRVEVSDDGGLSWHRVTNAFGLGRDQLLNGSWTSLPAVSQKVDLDDYYEYREDLVGGPGNAQIFPVGNVLARWQTAGLTGMWKVRLVAKDSGGFEWPSAEVAVRIDSAPPIADLTITTGGGSCADFTVGDLVGGTYSVSDEHLGGLTLSIQPGNGGEFTQPLPLPAGSKMPLSRSYPLVPPTHDSGTWELDTKLLPRCGYVIRLDASDRTIVDSGYVGRSSVDVEGLCLREPEK